MQLHQRFEIECKHKILIACNKLNERFILPLSLSLPNSISFTAFSFTSFNLQPSSVGETIHPTLAMQNAFQFSPENAKIHITNKYLDVINNLMLCNNELKKRTWKQVHSAVQCQSGTTNSGKRRTRRAKKNRAFSLRDVYSDLNGFERQKRNNSTCTGRSSNKVSTLQQSAITEQRKDQNKFNLRKR